VFSDADVKASKIDKVILVGGLDPDEALFIAIQDGVLAGNVMDTPAQCYPW